MKWWGLALLIVLLSAMACEAKTVEVTTKGRCAIVGMTSEQAIYVARQRARSAAIEQAAGVEVTSSTLVTNGQVAADFIKSFSTGYIIAETERWLPIDQYQPDAGSPPIPVYGVELTTKVHIPEHKRKVYLGLEATLNKKVFVSGEKVSVAIQSKKPAKIAVFNILEKGDVIMLYPNTTDRPQTRKNRMLSLPPAASGKDIVLVNSPGHSQDAEGFLVAALAPSSKTTWLDVFTPEQTMKLDHFFKRYVGLYENIEDTILPYLIVNSEITKR